MANKSAHKAKMRAKILEEASYALRSKGLSGVSLAELMQRAGLTHGGFYAYYATRDELVAEAIAAMFDGTKRMLDESLTDRSAKEGMSILLDFYLSEANVRNLDKGCAIPALSSETSRMSQAAKHNFQEGVRMFQSRLAAALDAAGNADSHVLARAVLAEMVGAISLARSMQDDDAAIAFVDAARSDLKKRLALV